MAKLNTQASRAIREAGFTKAQWAAMWGYTGGEWGGDECGCFDDRCIGHHHDGSAGCGCLESMLDDAVAWRRATRRPNDVELAAPIGIFRFVTVTTPGTAVTTSASAGLIGTFKEETIVRIQPREGWTAEVTQKDGKIEIQIVKAASPADGQEVPSA